jgi:hypothetical protein
MKIKLIAILIGSCLAVQAFASPASEFESRLNTAIQKADKEMRQKAISMMQIESSQRRLDVKNAEIYYSDPTFIEGSRYIVHSTARLDVELPSEVCEISTWVGFNLITNSLGDKYVQTLCFEK